MNDIGRSTASRPRSTPQARSSPTADRQSTHRTNPSTREWDGKAKAGPSHRRKEPRMSPRKMSKAASTAVRAVPAQAPKGSLAAQSGAERQRGGKGKSVSVRGEHGGRR